MYTQEVDLSQLGIKFTFPDGWTGQEEGEYLLAGHTSIPGLMILFQNQSMSTEELKLLALQGIREEGVSLQPKGDFTVVSPTRVEGFYEGNFQGATVTTYAIGLIDGRGKGVSILILTETDKFGDEHISEAKKLAKTVEFYAPKNDDVARWKSKLIGRKLKYMYTSGGTDYDGTYSGSSDVTIINLFMDTTFNYYSNSNFSFDIDEGFGNVNSNENTIGNFQILNENGQTYLQLKFSGGKTHNYELTQNEKGQTFLNGTRYFVVAQD